MNNKKKSGLLLINTFINSLKYVFILGLIILVGIGCKLNSSEQDKILYIIENPNTATSINRSWQDIYLKNVEKTVIITSTYNDGREYTGSGFFIKKDVIATNFHVVDPINYDSFFDDEDLSYLQNITVSLFNSDSLNVLGVNYSLENKDIAFLQVPIQDIEPFELGNFNSLSVLDEILHIGNPLDLNWSANPGVISAIRKASDVDAIDWIDPNTDILQTNVSSDHGSSGGIILNTQGEVVAILFSGLGGFYVSGEFRFGISVDYIKSKLNYLPFYTIDNIIDEYIDQEYIDNDGDYYSENDGDCNDMNPNIYPGAPEICNDNIDQNCDGSDLICSGDYDNIDNDFDGITENEGDCDDMNATVYPDATEICDDGIDQNCDGIDFISNDALPFNSWISDSIDEGEEKWYFFDAIIGQEYEISWDDSFSGSNRYTADIKVSAYRENKINYYFKELDSGYYESQSFNAVNTEKIYLKVEGYYPFEFGSYAIKVNNLLSAILLSKDDDGDGYSEGDGDCNDFDVSINPQATEICDDGIDQNCDGIDFISNNALPFNSWISDSINEGEEKWYFFDAIIGQEYDIYWDDSFSGSNRYTADIKVSAYRENKITSYFKEIDSGYYDSQSFNAVSTERIYIKVKGYFYYYYGNFSVRVSSSLI